MNTLGSSEALVLHALKLIEGYGPATVQESIRARGQTAPYTAVAQSASVHGRDRHGESRRDGSEPLEKTGPDGAKPALPELPVPANGMDIPGTGLW